MAIKKFTMDDVDKEILQIIQQQNAGQSRPNEVPNTIKSLIDRAKGKRNSNNGNGENQT